MSEKILQILEAMLLTAGEPLSPERIQVVLTTVADRVKQTTFMIDDENDSPPSYQSEETSREKEPSRLEQSQLTAQNEKVVYSIAQIRQGLLQLAELYQDRGVELVEVASGFRFQAKSDYMLWIQCLLEKKPARYSRALLETLALIAYRQPITRGEIEEIRGVAVSAQIIKTLLEREWVRVLGTRDVPGKPSLLGTTRQFLDDFNLKSLTDLPALPELIDLEAVASECQLPPVSTDPSI